RKLFWALWGPSFGNEQLTNEQLQEYQHLAQTLHDRRLESLYVDPNVAATSNISTQEADRIVALASSRLELERAYKIKGLDDSKELRLFLKVSSDPERRKEIFGGSSMAKLSELGGTKEWIMWLFETYKKNEEEMRALAQKEMARVPPDADEVEGNK